MTIARHLSRALGAALVAAITLAVASPAAHARFEKGRQLDFRIVIPAILRVAFLEAPAFFQVPASAGRVSVEPEETTVVRVQNNCRSGVNVAAELVDADVERAHLEVDGRQLVVERGGAAMSIPFWGSAPREFKVRYRMDLKAGAPEGARPWPVVLQFSNCA
ncbi:MAG: hypothetical protein IPH30_04880 [Betaproteobacteria bacterium]|nr:hypothetical protein [Betaproteobacteria bacterium]